jgi:hypothetical protein
VLIHGGHHRAHEVVGHQHHDVDVRWRPNSICLTPTARYSPCAGAAAPQKLNHGGVLLGRSVRRGRSRRRCRLLSPTADPPARARSTRTAGRSRAR